MELNKLDNSAGPSRTHGLDDVGIPSSSLGPIESPSEEPTGPSSVKRKADATGSALPGQPRPEQGADGAAPQSEAAIPTPPKDEAGPVPPSTGIGPSTDQPAVLEHAQSAGPALMMTLLLTSGARHPYKIDKKYLKKRSVDAVNEDPFNLSVYTLKELIWREWREGEACSAGPWRPLIA